MPDIKSFLTLTPHWRGLSAGHERAGHEGQRGDGRGRVVGVTESTLGEGSAAADHVVDTVTQVSTRMI